MNYKSYTDFELFRLMKEDDFHAFGELYKRYWPSLVNAAFKRLNRRDKSEDIAQNIFADLYARRNSINLAHSLKSYLHQALKYKVLNEYRDALVRARYQEQLFFGPVCENDFANPVETQEFEQHVKNVIQKLPVRCRQVFSMSRDYDLSNKEISHEMQITISTVEQHITRALKTLRNEIKSPAEF
ncbi:MAG TPA: RNA polymerase sigma-70 factor [Chitinophagaceae bacterium]